MALPKVGGQQQLALLCSVMDVTATCQPSVFVSVCKFIECFCIAGGKSGQMLCIAAVKTVLCTRLCRMRLLVSGQSRQQKCC